MEASAGGCLHLVGVAGHDADELLDLQAEVVDHALDGLLAMGSRLLLGFGLLGQPAALDGIVAEHAHGAEHAADLVLAAGKVERHVGVASGQPPHGGGEDGDRPGDEPDNTTPMISASSSAAPRCRTW
jgi:hypothetical protein